MKKTVILSISAACAALMFTGCGIKTHDYSASAKNVSELRKYEDVKIAVENFTSQNPGEKHSTCRMADTVTTPQGESFEEYITNAFKEELQMAGIYDATAELKISGHIEKIYGSSMLGNAYWLIEATVTSSKNKSLSVSTKREYPSSYLASSACNNMATSFAPTVEELVHDIITHKDFDSLIR